MLSATITDMLMNTLHKSLTIAFLAVYIFVSGLTVVLFGAQYSTVGTKTFRHPVDLTLSQYFKFRRLTT